MTKNNITEKGMNLGYLALALAAAALAAAACAHRKTMAASAPAPQAKAAAAASGTKTAASDAPPAETFSQLGRGLALHKYWGIVESSSGANDELTIKSKSGHVKDFIVLSDTRVNEGGDDAAIKFAQIKAGEHVRVVYAGKYAKAIHVMILPSHGG